MKCCAWEINLHSAYDNQRLKTTVATEDCAVIVLWRAVGAMITVVLNENTSTAQVVFLSEKYGL